jgi:hypothetical protein
MILTFLASVIVQLAQLDRAAEVIRWKRPPTCLSFVALLAAHVFSQLLLHLWRWVRKLGSAGGRIYGITCCVLVLSDGCHQTDRLLDAAHQHVRLEGLPRRPSFAAGESDGG